MTLMADLTENLCGLEVNPNGSTLDKKADLGGCLSDIRSITNYDSLISFLKSVSTPSKIEIDIGSNYPVTDEHRKIFGEIKLNAEISHRDIEKQRLYARWLFFPGYDYESAFKIYCNVLRLDPKDPYAHHYIGKILDNHRIQQAELLFREGIKLPADRILHPKFHHDIAYFFNGDLNNKEFQLHYDLGFEKHSTEECPVLKR